MRKLHLPWWVGGTAVAVAATLSIRDAYIASLSNLVAIAALTAVSLRFVLLMGELNFATAAFVGLGAYSTGAAVTIFDWPFLISLAFGGVSAMAVSVVFGFVTLRTKGPYFLLIGFAFTEAVRILYSKSNALGGTSGMIGIFPPAFMDSWMPAFVMASAALLIFVLFCFEQSGFGRILTGIRDNESVVQTVGIDVLACKVACFAIASFAAGIAGSLHAFVNNVISPGDFSFLVAAFALAAVKVGGEKTIAGPIIGSAVLVLLSSYALALGGEEHIFYGAAMVLAVLLMPDGIGGLAARAGIFAAKRGTG